MKNSLLLKSTLALALATPLLASAESQLSTGTTPAVARLDFRVVIPRVVYLAVGTPAAGIASGGTIDTVTFDFTLNPGAVGTGAAAGTITGNAVPVRVLGNDGAITLTATTSGALQNAGGDSIPWSEITAVSSAPALLPSPTIPATGTGPSSAVAVSSGRITDRTATWTFGYANSAIVPPGTYGSSPTNGRVTYTASML